MPVHISLLRAVNVGGRNRMKMATLRGAYESLGLTSVQTLLQSGNVVFQSDTEKDLRDRLEKVIDETFGFRACVILRSAAELRQVVADAPFDEERRAEPKRVLAVFLSDRPDKAAFRRLIERHEGPETLELRGKELFVHYVDGIGRSKLTGSVIERELKTSGTARNWDTVTKLLDIAKAVERGVA